MGEGSVDQAVECRLMARVRRGAHDLDLEVFGNVTRIGVRDIQRRILFPDRVDGLGQIVLGQRNLVAAMVVRSRSIRIVCPAKERVAFTAGQRLAVDIVRVADFRCGAIYDVPLGAPSPDVVKVVIQMVGVLGGGRFLRNKENIIICLRAENHIATCIETLNVGRVFSFFRPADKFITLFQNVFCQQFLRSCLDRSNGNGVRANAVWAVRTMQRTGEGLLLPQVVLVALRVDAVINVQDIAVDLRVVVSGGCTLKIIVSSVLTIGKERRGAFTFTVAAAASPGNVVNLIVVYTFPDVLGIWKTEVHQADIILSKVNRDVVAADAFNRMAIDQVVDLDFHAGDSVVHRRMQHDRAITRRQRRYRQHAEHHNQNQQKSNESLLHYFGSPPFYCLFRVVETDLC